MHFCVLGNMVCLTYVDRKSEELISNILMLYMPTMVSVFVKTEKQNKWYIVSQHKLFKFIL